MPQPLRPTDSFNSSTATIVPDKRRADSNNSRFYPQGVPQSRALVSTSSLERHINSALRVNAGGDDGMIGLLHTQTQDMGGNGLSGLSFMREFIQLPPEDNPQPQSSSSQTPSIPSLPQQTNFIPNTHTFEPVPSPHFAPPSSTFDPIPLPHANTFATLTSPVEPSPNGPSDYFRPSSVNSYHSHAASSVDASEYYSTTDMDTDDDDLASIHDVPPLAVKSNIGDLGMGNIHLENNNHKADILNWMNYQTHTQDQRGSISPNEIKTQSQVVSPSVINHPPPARRVSSSASKTGRAVSNVAGPSKGRRSTTKRVIGTTDEEKIRLDKLEHRRDINRRSAQKHRLQRKKDMEILTQQLAERDARIHQLQRDLEVEKARNDQLRILMNNRLANSGGQGANSG
ncbi:uncharacterized protein L199_000845 [Kwoniella botswanensis]|uniref:uncharacterized protein n=1 Tax=Kwoniella botswanensis TaxID=1268659 RepID=UPI00315D2859